ncbi:hypothetical protein BaRGS_00020071 [Batillaria attramentaria]|uniref:Uncharacterized protein n=1 Tax=Batillaria attramentaria TaxID=370345 RepID=A0ABD0KN06_9CAEN
MQTAQPRPLPHDDASHCVTSHPDPRGHGSIRRTMGKLFYCRVPSDPRCLIAFRFLDKKKKRVAKKDNSSSHLPVAWWRGGRMHVTPT